MCTMTAAIIGSVVGTMGSAYMQGRAQKEAYEAQARQAEANARLQAQQAEVAQQNALRANKNAEEIARTNAENVENERRRMLLREGQQKARIGASGITATGSALNALADTRWDIDKDTAASLYNGQQAVYKMFGQGTDYANQREDYKYQQRVYEKNADDYRAAGKRAFDNAMWGGALGLATSLSGSLYSSKSAAAQQSTVGGTVYTGAGNNGLGIAGKIMGTNFPVTKPTWNYSLGKR